MRKTIIGVMGPGSNATENDKQNAYTLGQLIAEKGWFLLTGGRNAGVMDAASKGAKNKNGFTIGIIPTSDNTNTSEFVDVAIITSMASARNNINVLSCDVVIACGMEAGTASEVAMAIKAGKNVIMLTDNEEAKSFFRNLRP
ncbi:TIGR00725 family protein, partial [Candidatus Woesebacteria bacterium]|nr:TIGR00725 family protein [Candidatus Woesebacteria bacterium]